MNRIGLDSKPHKKSIRQLEKEFNILLRRFGFGDYRVIVDPNPDKNVYGEVDRKNHIIYIYTCDEKFSYRVFYHETLEIICSRVLAKHKKLINKLLEYIEEDFYLEKEKALNKILDIFHLFPQDNPPVS